MPKPIETLQAALRRIRENIDRSAVDFFDVRDEDLPSLDEALTELALRRQKTPQLLAETEVKVEGLKRAIRNALAQLGDTSVATQAYLENLALVDRAGNTYDGDPGHAAAYLRDALKGKFPSEEPPEEFARKAGL